jgi:hypothetical protein
MISRACVILEFPGWPAIFRFRRPISFLVIPIAKRRFTLQAYYLRQLANLFLQSVFRDSVPSTTCFHPKQLVCNDLGSMECLNFHNSA